MSATASSSKTTTANAILYKKAKDILRLSTIEKSDPRRTLLGFRAVSGFTKRWDLTKNDEWEGYGETVCEALVKGYWHVHDQEHNELDALYLSLARKEATELESKRISEEKKKKKSKSTAPITSGSGSGEGKETDIEVIDDSESNADTRFRESCVGCGRAKVKCIFTHAPNGKKVTSDRCYNLHVISSLQWSLNALSNVDTQDLGLWRLENDLPNDTSVPEELQDVVQHGHSHVIEHYNNIALMCGVQMKSISSRYKLGKGFEGWVPMLNPYGELDLKGEADKKVRIGKEPESGEKEVEKEVGPDLAPVVDKGKGKKKEAEPEEIEEDC
ncbi:hypothetical protein M422DRAFT_263418 [Sphaerobolus stellatus SS14]|uniref:Uncharacterized protein n=1 Tax=Sphaerobolus stellatus (strain SS14) TaxID=990650 RepID=A0A0C9VAG4_SPHS4|nr:hypothetical protein M422DRAFT_263418 [Sphaerobolus stellatus SS14]